MSSPRRTATQAQVLEAARALLEDEGASAVRLADVARDAGVSRQAVYLHFGSRVGLVVALVQYIDDTARVREQAVRWRAPGLSAPERLDAFLAWWGGYLPKIRAAAVALLAERHTDAAADAAWRDRMAALHATGRFLVDELRAEGMLAPQWTPVDAADWLWALVSVQLGEVVRERGWSDRRYAERLRRVVRAALLELTA